VWSGYESGIIGLIVYLCAVSMEFESGEFTICEIEYFRAKMVKMKFRQSEIAMFMRPKREIEMSDED